MNVRVQKVELINCTVVKKIMTKHNNNNNNNNNKYYLADVIITIIVKNNISPFTCRSSKVCCEKFKQVQFKELNLHRAFEWEDPFTENTCCSMLMVWNTKSNRSFAGFTYLCLRSLKASCWRICRFIHGYGFDGIRPLFPNLLFGARLWSYAEDAGRGHHQFHSESGLSSCTASTLLHGNWSSFLQVGDIHIFC